jgi:hypothetical protein
VAYDGSSTVLRSRVVVHADEKAARADGLVPDDGSIPNSQLPPGAQG